MRPRGSHNGGSFQETDLVLNVYSGHMCLTFNTKMVTVINLYGGFIIDVNSKYPFVLHRNSFIPHNHIRAA